VPKSRSSRAPSADRGAWTDHAARSLAGTPLRSSVPVMGGEHSGVISLSHHPAGAQHQPDSFHVFSSVGRARATG
jgi:hypothetical protein